MIINSFQTWQLNFIMSSNQFRPFIAQQTSKREEKLNQLRNRPENNVVIPREKREVEFDDVDEFENDEEYQDYQT